MFSLKKTFLYLASVALAAPAALAQTVTMHTPSNFQVISVSPNGKWAAGVFVDGTMNIFGFRWNLESGTIEMLSKDSCTAYDVANDGTVSGDFGDREATSTGASLTMPGYWRDGSWHHVETPAGNVTDGIGYGISPDGQYITGSICIDQIYRPFIWKNGKIHREIPVDNHGISFAVSPDGNSAAGFLTQYNRTACLWPAEGGVITFEDSDYAQSPWNYSRNFSPDGTKLVYWGGWKEEEGIAAPSLYTIYDINTGERVKVQAPAYESDLEFYDISNTSVLVGSDRGRGYVWTPEDQGMVVDDYLAKIGVDLSSFDDFYAGTDYYQGQLPIFNVVSLSEDAKVLALLYYNTIGQQASMIIKYDQDFSNLPPVEVKGIQLAGLNAVSINWKRPIGANSIRGYNIYRDGKKINGFLTINVPYYFDRDVEVGEHEYVVAAVSTSGVETRGEAVKVVVAANELQQPFSLFARNKGINDALVTWHTPMSNVVHKYYHDKDADDYSGFYIYDPLDVELAVSYDKNEMALYKGYKISEVSFIPMDDQQAWKVNIYTRDDKGNLQLIHSQPVTQTLNKKEINTVQIDGNVLVPTGDLIVGIEVKTKDGHIGVIGALQDSCIPGRTDLLRQHADEDFFSTWDSSIGSGLYVSMVTWAIDLGLVSTTAAANPSVKEYNVYLNDDLVVSTDNTRIELEDIEDGDYLIGVQAVYADGATSDISRLPFTLKAAYPQISDFNLVVEGQSAPQVTATWTAPVNNDLTHISYTKVKNASTGIQGNESNGYALMAAAEYPSTMLRGYEGYKIKSFRFWPMADALFTFFLFEDDEQIYELEVEDLTFNAWNEVVLPDELTIKRNSTYRLIIDCFDPEPDVRVLGVSSGMAIGYMSDLYSTDNGETWSSLVSDAGINSSWLLDMVIEDQVTKDSGILGYDVVVDGKKRNDALVNDTQYTHQFAQSDNYQHALRIDTHYANLDEPVVGVATYFRINVSGIDDAAVTEITLRQGDNYLVAEGAEVVMIEVYSSTGAKVAAANSDKVDISALVSGTYIVHVATTTNTVTRKINIR